MLQAEIEQGRLIGPAAIVVRRVVRRLRAKELNVVETGAPLPQRRGARQGERRVGPMLKLGVRLVGDILAASCMTTARQRHDGCQALEPRRGKRQRLKDARVYLNGEFSEWLR